MTKKDPGTLEAQLRAAKEELAHLRAYNERGDKQANEMRKVIDRQQEEINRVRQELTQQTSTIARQQVELEKRSGEVSRWKRAMAAIAYDDTPPGGVRFADGLLRL